MASNFYQHALFEGVPQAELEKLLLQARIRLVLKDEILIKEGEYGDSLYYIMRGEFEVFYYVKENTKQTLAFMKTGEFIGEGIFASDQDPRRSAYVMAVCNSKVLELKGGIFTDFLNKNPIVKERLLKRKSTQQHERILLSTLATRIAY